MNSFKKLVKGTTINNYHQNNIIVGSIVKRALK